ncbi:calcium-binding protein [soil metagenome]
MSKYTVVNPGSAEFGTLFFLLAFNALANPPDNDDGLDIAVARGSKEFRVVATLSGLMFGLGGDEIRVSVGIKGNNFTYDNGVPTGGTATSIVLRVGGATDSIINEFSVPLKTVYEALSAPFSEDVNSPNEIYSVLGNRLSFLGNINFFGSSGDDFGLGSNGKDLLSGSAGDDFLLGFNNDDRITGSNGDDNLDGGFGNDRLAGDRGNDSLKGGGGDDYLKGGLGNDDISGGTGNDTILGHLGNNDLSGFFGNDLLYGSINDDTIDGGPGIDRVSYANLPVAGGIVVDLSTENSQNTGNAGFDQLIDVENLTATQFNDTITGSDSNNDISGMGGDDILLGGFGKDTLRGGDGNDFMQGGTQDDRLDGGAGDDIYFGDTGKDVFVFASGTQTTMNETINDFTLNADKIDLSGIDANITTANTNEVFKFIGNTAYTPGQTRELKFFFDGANTVVEGDTDHDGVSDFKITLLGHIELRDVDFVL